MNGEIIKDKLSKRELMFGTIVLFSDPSITELLGKMGFDALWIDMEHTAREYSNLLVQLMAASSAHCPALVRVADNDEVLIKRALEQGPDGIIIPMINSPQDLEIAMKSTLYPPHGNRGFGPLRAVSYGIDDQVDYIEWSRTGLIRCVQIESKVAVEAMEQMVNNPYVDCFIIGPCDLSGSIGKLFSVDDPETLDLIKKAALIAKNAGKSMGIAIGWEELSKLELLKSFGINFFFIGSDASYLINHSKSVLATVSKLL